MSDTVQQIREEIEKELLLLDKANDFDNGRFCELSHLKLFIDNLPGNNKNLEKKSHKVGDTFKPKGSRVEYTVVDVFEDNGEDFIVAKKPTNYGSWTYRNVFAYDKNGELFGRS